MHSLLLVTFFLVQVLLLQAEEFPNLMKHIEITWDSTNITSKVDTRHTMSTDEKVPSFIFCGPFKTYGNDANCTLKYSYKFYPSYAPAFLWEATGNETLTAKFVSSINSSYSCMNLQNNIVDFAELYSRTEQGSSYGQYSLSYTCETIGFRFTETVMTILAVIAVLAMASVGAWGYKRGQKKCVEDSLRIGENYQGYQAPEVYGGKTV